MTSQQQPNLKSTPEIREGECFPWSYREHIDVLVGFSKKSAEETIIAVKRYLDSLESQERASAADRLLVRALSPSLRRVDVSSGTYETDHYAGLVRELLAQGANPNKWDGDRYYTPFLHFCEHPSNYQTMQILIDEGNADVNAADKWNRGGFRKVVSNSSADRPASLETVNLFLNRGADPRLPCNDGILHLSHGLDDQTIVRLIDAGADVNHLKEHRSEGPESPRLLLLDCSMWSRNQKAHQYLSVLDSVAEPEQKERIKFWISQGARHYRASTVETIRLLGIEYDAPALEATKNNN